MDCFLVYSFNRAGVVFNCLENGEPTPVSGWGHSEIKLKEGNSANIGVLNLLLEEEKAGESGDGLGVEISHSELAGLETWTFKAFFLPRMAPFRLVIQTHGTLANENFSVE